MDIDENDLLYSNVFIPKPELNTEISNESNEEFKKFYKQEESLNKERKLKDTLDRMSIRSVYLNEDTDANSILNNNRFNNDSTSITSLNKNKLTENTRRIKEIVTYISIDSRDRDKLVYKNASKFKIFLGKTFYNVKSIKLASVEFPNTNAVINSNNNQIYWRNLEDITSDTINAITETYPIYDVSLRIGSYISGSLQTEITNKLATIKRKDGNSDYHYFIVSLDIDTDIVTFTSLILTQLPNNPIQTSSNSTVLRINAPNHGYVNNEFIYLVGAKTLAGIQSTTINAKHKIVVIDSNTFDIEINVKGGETLLGGGNTVKSGRIAPFQLLFGEYPKTVAQNLGFPLENSSELINTYIKSITNFYQAIITTKTPHLFLSNFNYLGQTCNISGSGTSPIIDGSKIITRIISTTSFAIQMSNTLDLTSFNSGQITFNGTTFDIQSINNNNSNTILIETFTEHNYSLDDINKNIILYNTTTTPTIDGDHAIYQIFNSNTFVIPGDIPSGGEIINSVNPGDSGSIPRNNPLTTHTIKITNAIIGPTLFLTCPNHKLQVGDTFMIYNLITSPPIANSIVTVFSIPTPNTIVINTPINSIDMTNINSEIAYIGTGLFSVSFPNHGFNNIVSIQNTSGYPAGQTVGNLLILQTQLPHNFTNGDLVRLNNTNSTPIIDDSYTVSVINSDTFTIPYSFPIISPGTSGLIGFNQNFYLYGSTNVGGILSSNINNTSYTVRDIIDTHNFTFYKQNDPAHTAENGGGNSLYISSLLHGFNGQQTNTKNNLLNRSINLEGENYSFLCCPQLSTMLNTGNVKDVFARITLDQSPGSVVFSYMSNPKTFDTTPLNRLEDLEFSVLNYDGSFYEFNDLDYSFTLEITEVIDITDHFNISSKRGIVDN
jgi:hypothetical protein